MKSLAHTFRLAVACAALGAACPKPAAAAFSEPPLVLFGKVLQVGPGGNYQLYTGELRFSLVAAAEPTHAITHAVPLRRVGDEGGFSYRIEIPQQVLPEVGEPVVGLEVAHAPGTYRVESITVDGQPAALLDPAQLPELVSSFANRAGQYRLDLMVNLPQTDADGDALPDWWEDRHGLNRHSAADARLDADGDGLTNEEEFLAGTDPNTPNHEPVVQTKSLRAPAGGIAGVFLAIIDQDTAPANLQLRLIDDADGLTWRRESEALGAGDSFSYADVLSGTITVAVASDFDEATVRMGLHDQEVDGASEIEFALQVQAFSPGRRTGAPPDVWLDAIAIAGPGPVAEWPDLSGEARDGYQPAGQAQPDKGTDGSVGFDGERFLYVDDRGLELDRFTALMAFDWSGEGAQDQTLFSSPEVQLRIGGDSRPGRARSLSVTQAGRTVNGPVLNPGRPYQLTLESSAEMSWVRLADTGRFPSGADGVEPLSTFMTLGALQPFSASAAREFLHGSIREVLVYGHPLDADVRSRIEDYQRSRWERAILWDYRASTFPADISGVPEARNILRGGWGPDRLQGGDLADVLSGGPGKDRLTGGSGADWFEVSAADGDEVITDFRLEEKDVLDLTSLFADRTGLPSQYLRVRTRVTRGDDDVPRVDSILELDHDGGGGVVDQTIVLEGLSVGGSDLPRLVGEGRIQFGGPRYPTSVSLVAETTELVETGHAWTVQMERAGNLDAALDVSLTLTGTATPDRDYLLEGASGSGVVRTVSFGRGQATVPLQVVSIPDRETESETIELHVVPSPRLTGIPAGPLTLTLEEAPTLSIYPVQAAEPARDIAGIVEIVRTGRAEPPVEIALGLEGTVVNGRDYELLPSTVTLAAGETSRRIEIRPAPDYDAPGEPAAHVAIRLRPDPAHHAIQAPGQALVMFLPEGVPPAPTFADWRRLHFPGNTDPDLGLRDPDLDGLTTIQEHVLGTHPHEANEPAAGALRIEAGPDGFSLRLQTINSLTDVILRIEASHSLHAWQDATDDFDLELRWLPDGRIERRYHPREVTGLSPSTFYRWSAVEREFP